MVQVKNFSPPPVRREEIWRYAAAGPMTEETAALAEECLTLAAPTLAYRVCWQEFPLSITGDEVDVGFARFSSAALARRLAGSSRVVVFAATVGLEVDRLITRYGRLSPSKALWLDAIGTERVESLCDAFCEELALDAAARGLCATRRFSPGYGDLPLTLQRDVFQVLGPARRIGLTLNDSLLMSPSKSVTALVGLGDKASSAKETCAVCPKADCAYRRKP